MGGVDYGGVGAGVEDEPRRASVQLARDEVMSGDQALQRRAAEAQQAKRVVDGAGDRRLIGDRARALKCRMRDLFHALELEEGPGADLNLLRKLIVPGSLDLLTAYEHLPPEARMPLLSFVRNVLPNGATGRKIQS
jgi:hypothetical protein